MSIFSSVRRAFGFSSEDEEADYDPMVPTYDVKTSTTETPVASPSNATPQPTVKEQSVCTDSDASLVGDLFDSIIELFNKTQPEFVRECLNTDAQRQYILNSLSESLRQRVEAVMKSNNQNWEKEKEALEKKIANLEGDDNELVQLRNENRKLQLSVDRQKRALLDRINDLEAQLIKHAQERERYYTRRHQPDNEQLTNLTAQIKELQSEIEASKQKIEELESQNKALETIKSELEDKITNLEATSTSDNQSTADKDGDENTNASIAELKAQFAEFENEIDSLKKANAEAQEEIARQTTLKEQLEVKTSMSDAIINDLRNQAAAARKELEEMQNEQNSALTEIQSQLDAFEELKAKKDTKIAELQESNASLRQTIEANLYNQANSEMKLRSEIKMLKAEIETLSAQRASAESNNANDETASMVTSSEKDIDRQPKRRTRSKKVRIDSELDNTDWFAGGSSKHDNPDFGYHEPPRRPVNDNEAQLSLFE